MQIQKVQPNLSEEQLRFVCFIINAAVTPLAKVIDILSFEDAELMRNALYREWVDPTLASPFGNQVADALITHNNSLSRIVPENYLDPEGSMEVEKEVRKAAALVILDWMPLLSVDYVKYLNEQIKTDIDSGTVNLVSVDYSTNFLDTILDWYERGHVLVSSGCVLHYINKVIRPESREIIRDLIVILQARAPDFEAPLTLPAAIDICPKADLTTPSIH